jgi:lipopolysaccharide/colanic/teichoic acid biosynthesis glycosyltransferase
VQKFKMVKRIFDIGLSIFGVLLFAPLGILLGVIILLYDGRPIFYCQNRVGKKKQIFKAVKFRSMKKDAEKQTGPVLAKENDPRITPIGKLMRVTAMDELPQLINILMGDMSFVGPRPERPEMVAQFSKEFSDYDNRHKVRPGLTGIAQVFGSYDSPANKKLKYDLLYIKKQSFCLDIYLIWLSVWITICGHWDLRDKIMKRK